MGRMKDLDIVLQDMTGECSRMQLQGIIDTPEANKAIDYLVGQGFIVQSRDTGMFLKTSRASE